VGRMNNAQGSGQHYLPCHILYNEPCGRIQHDEPRSRLVTKTEASDMIL
jgi:hypothetical protein